MSFAERIMKASNNWCDRKCYICGEYFQEGDKIAFIVPTYEYKKLFPALGLNVVAHSSEIDIVKSHCESEDKFLEALGLHKTPRKPNTLNKEQLKHIEEFIQACRQYRFYESTRTKNGVKCKLHGSSDTLEYNARTDKIHHSSKRRSRGLFDGLFIQQLITNVWNEMHKLLGDGKHDDYNARNIIQSAVDKINEMLGK